MSDNFADQMKKAVSDRKFSFKKIVASVLFGAIVMVFIFYGFATQNASEGHVAIVNHHIVTVMDLKREQRRVEQMYQRIFGNSMDFSSQRQNLIQEAVQSLINTELVSQAAEKEGLSATDQEVVNFIVKDYTIFQTNGVFQRNMYYQFLENNGFSPADFESLIRKDIENQRSRQAFEWGSTPNQLEIEKQKKLKETSVTLSYMVLDPKLMETQIKPTPSEIAKALQDSAFQKRVEDEFKARRNQFDQADQVRAQHILIKTIPGDLNSEKSALSKIQSLKAQIPKSDFGTLAEKNSEDPGSKANKGDLGFFGKGQMVPEFEKAAFAMKIGEVSDVIKTQFGYHLLKLTDKKEAKMAVLDNHKNELAQILLARDLFTTQKNKAKEVFSSTSGGSEEWMKSMNLKWLDTAAFDLAADKIPELSDKVMDSLGTLMTKPQEAQVFQDGDKTYIVKLKEIKNQKLADAKAKDLETDSRVRANDAFSAWVQNYRESVKVEINPQVLK